MPTKSEIALQTVDVADKIHDLYEAAQKVEIARQALKAAKTAKEVSEAQKALKAAEAAKALAATTLAATLVNLLVKEDVAAGITTILSALSTIEAAGTIATSGLSAAAGSLVISILGFILNIVIVFGFAKSPPRVYWDGRVKVKFDPKTFSFGFSIKTVSYKERETEVYLSLWDMVCGGAGDDFELVRRYQEQTGRRLSIESIKKARRFLAYLTSEIDRYPHFKNYLAQFCCELRVILIKGPTPPNS